MTEREKLRDLIISAKRDDPETGSFTEWLTDYLLANGVTVQQWIPVEERLPTKDDANNDGDILAVWVGNKIMSPAPAICRGSCAQDWRYVVQHPDWFSHWKPLPEPPKEET